MYVASARAADQGADQAADQAADETTEQAVAPVADRGPLVRRVSGNVLALGTVSLLTDVSSEMVTAILPVYLVLGLGLSPLGVGLIDGLYTGVTAAVRLVGGQVADRTQRRKAVAGLGYGLSAVCKLGLLAAGASVGWLSAVIGLDRTGKGLRTAPRDALISLSSDPRTVGRAFGVHRAMDTAGAMAGPLLAFALLLAVPRGYDVVFVTSFCIAALGVVVLVLFVRDRRGPLEERRRATTRATLALLAERPFRRICLLAAALGVVTVSDAFVYLLLQDRLDVAVQYFPLLPVGTALVYFLLAVPAGRLADRWGRWPMFVTGNGVLAGAYLLLLLPGAGFWLLPVTLALHGAYYATTNGVLMAAVTPSLPEHLRAGGMALVQTGTAAAALVSSVSFGALWAAAGPRTALVVFLAGMLAGVALAATVGRPTAPAAAPQTEEVPA